MENKNLKITDYFSEILSEVINETKNPYHIIVLINEKDLQNFDHLNEGRWVSSDESGFVQRVDKPHFDQQLLHVHIAREKNINTKNKQVAWNNDGTRHDKKSFNDNFIGMETAKRIARSALRLPNNFKLESFNVIDKVELILESVMYVHADTSLFIFEAKNLTEEQILLI